MQLRTSSNSDKKRGECEYILDECGGGGGAMGLGFFIFFSMGGGWNYVLYKISWERGGGVLEFWKLRLRGDIIYTYIVTACLQLQTQTWTKKGRYKVIQTKNTIFSFQSDLILKLVCLWARHIFAWICV